MSNPLLRELDHYVVLEPGGSELILTAAETLAWLEAWLAKLEPVPADLAGLSSPGLQAQRLGLVDSLGGLTDALKSAAVLAKLTGDYDVREYPRMKSATERLTELLENRPEPVASKLETMMRDIGTAGPAAQLARDLTRELSVLLTYTDPRGVYARMPYILRIR